MTPTLAELEHKDFLIDLSDRIATLEKEVKSLRGIVFMGMKRKK